MILFKWSFGGTAAAAIIFLAGMSAPALATTVSYDEAVDGDIDSLFSTSLNFDVGVNTVSGTQFFNISGFDVDNFGFVIASGQMLTSVSYAYDPFDVASNTSSLGPSQFLSSSSTILTSQVVVVLDGGSPVDLFSGFLPLGAGIYSLGQALRRNGDGGFWDYTFSFTVEQISAVPLPAALPLFGSALGLFGFAGWRRRRKLESAA